MPDSIDLDAPAAAATAAALAHLQAIATADEILDDGGDLPGDHPALGAWDGCSDCVAREALAVALPAYRAALLAQVLTHLRAGGEGDTAAAADALERDLTLPT